MEIGEATDSQQHCNSITVNIKFSGRFIPVTLSPESTVKDLKSLLQPLTNVLARGQKLIFKGKLLVDAMTLKASEVTNGAKVMLMASQGLHQGDGPIRKDPTVVPSLRRTVETDQEKKMKKEVSIEKNQLQRWKATGVVALSECNLKAIPDEVWSCGSSARVVDLSHNSLQDVPAEIGCLSSLQKLLLNTNHIMDKSICWTAVTSLKSLTMLALDQNQLEMLPSALGALTGLRQLHVANNNLTCLPSEIGFLTQLQVLKVNNNRISVISSSIGDCISLIEVDLSSNLLVEIPETFGNLKCLKTMRVHNNGLKSLPSTLFKMCIQLSTLDLHGTEITMDLLRQLEGWENFDMRRRLKHQKQLDFRAGGSAEFDEGADKS